MMFHGSEGFWIEVNIFDPHNKHNQPLASVSVLEGRSIAEVQITWAQPSNVWQILLPISRMSLFGAVSKSLALVLILHCLHTNLTYSKQGA